MLDPLLALSLASSVVQFVDFSIELIKNGVELYKKGSLAVNDELEQATNDLSSLMESLSAPPAQIPELLHQNPKPFSKDEVSLQKLATSCKGVGDQLLDMLRDAKMQGRQSGLESFRRTIRSAKNKKKINDLQKRLKQLQELLGIYLLSILKDKSSRVISLLEIVSENEANTSFKIDQLKGDLIAILESQRAAQSRSEMPIVNFADVGKKCQELEEQAHHRGRAYMITRSLYSRTIQERQVNVKDAHAETFEWAFSDEASETRPRSPFSKWLQSSDGIFWIAGKAGSGKSTLMKYICEHPATTRTLDEWAGQVKPLIASHFFWGAGTAMQKSQEGLIQSLLYQIFKQCPEIIQVVCPYKWNEAPSNAPFELIEPWTRQEIFDAFGRLADQELMSHKFCFFIDGLDEYDGEHLDLVRLLQRLGKSKNIKLCVSSRPWNVFMEAFNGFPERKLLLQEYTKEDIRTYVRDQLEENERFFLLMQEDGSYMNLILEIVEKAQGVFLWVYLVVRSLLRGLSENDDIDILQTRLRGLPPDLERYFKQVFENVEPVYREQTGQILQIVIHAVSPVSTMTIHFLRQKSSTSETPLENLSTWFTDEEVYSISEQIRKYINARCKDLLEVGNIDSKLPRILCPPRVEFLHRTVRDFLLTADMQSMLQIMTPSSFDVKELLCKILLAQMKSVALNSSLRKHSYSIGIFAEYMHSLLYFAREIEKHEGRSVRPILDEADPLYRIFSITTRSRNAEYYLGAAMISGLHIYVVERLENEDIDEQSSISKTLLLQYALMWSERPDNLLDFKIFSANSSEAQGTGENTIDLPMVKLLLEHGADPNAKCVGDLADRNGLHTVWECFLRFCPMFINKKPTRENCFQVAEMLIRYGADPFLTIPVDPDALPLNKRPLLSASKTLTIEAVMGAVLEPDQFGKFKMLLEEKRKAYRRERDPLRKIWNSISWN